MQLVEVASLKRGDVIILDGAPHLIEDCHFTGTAQSKRKLHCRLKNLSRGTRFERALNESDRVESPAIENRMFAFLYRDGDRFVFQDVESFEEQILTAGQLGDRNVFLKESEEYKGLVLEGRLIDIALPEYVPMKVLETAPPMRGGADNTWKPARLEGGLEVMVPLFIGPGDVVRVDTHTRKYLRKEGESA